MLNPHPWIATRLGMSCRISTADLIARIDDGAEQINNTTFLWREWVIQPATLPELVQEVPDVGNDNEASFADLQAIDLDLVA
jgi:hypothetical protein